MVEMFNREVYRGLVDPRRRVKKLAVALMHELCKLGDGQFQDVIEILEKLVKEVSEDEEVIVQDSSSC